jgi:hypothetical protein
MQHAVKMQKEKLGPDHPLTIQSSDTLETWQGQP